MYQEPYLLPMITPFSKAESLTTKELLPQYLNTHFEMVNIKTNELISWEPIVKILDKYNLLPEYKYKVCGQFMYSLPFICDWIIELYRMGPIRDFPIWHYLSTLEKEDKVEFAKLRDSVELKLIEFERSLLTTH